MMDAKIVGHFDDISEDGWLSGWALDQRPNSDKLPLEIVVDGTVIGAVRADQFRDDLKNANLRDASCAFWFRLPDVYRDGQTHEVSVRIAGTDLIMPGSPKQISLGAHSRDATLAESNLIPNASLSEWPNGLAVRPVNRYTQVATGWYFDFKLSQRADVVVSAHKPAGLALRGHEYAMEIEITGVREKGYNRLVVPLLASDLKAGTHFLSCGLRRPSDSADGTLRVGEIFLATVKEGDVARLHTVRKNIAPEGTIRIQNVPVDIKDSYLSAIEGGGHLALVLEFQESGKLQLFSPRLSRYAEAVSADDRPGRFEDDRIFGQVASLKLSPIWADASAGIQPSALAAEPLPRTKRFVRSTLPSMPFTQIVVPVFNAAQDVSELLSSIVKQTTGPFEVLLLDDGSNDYAKYRLNEWSIQDPRIRLISHGANIGYTRNINIGLQAVVADYAVLLNSDTLVTPRWLEKLHEALSVDSQTAGAGPVSNAASWQSIPATKASDGSWAVNAIRPGMTLEEYAALVESCSEMAFPEFPLLNGFCTLFRKSALEAVGYFDDETFPQGYGEENDLCLRLGKAGFKLRVADHCYVYHKKSKSFGAERRGDLSKRANQLIKGKHPEIKLPVLELDMANSEPMATLRKRLIEADQIEILNAPKRGTIRVIRGARKGAQA